MFMVQLIKSEILKMSQELLINTNITLDIYNIVLGIVLLISTYIRHVINRKVRIWFGFMLISNIIMSTADIFTWVFEGDAYQKNFVILPIAMFIFYLMSFSVIFCSGFYIINSLNQEKYKKVVKISLIASAGIYYATLLLTPFLQLLYNIDKNNIYSRGSYFFIPVVLDSLLYIHLFIYLIINRKTIPKRKVFPILSFLIFPQVLHIIQLLYYGISLVNTGYTIAFLIMFIEANRNLEETLDNTEFKLSEKEEELINQVHEAQNSKLEVIKMQNHTIESLSNLVENRDEDTGEHVRRTRAYVELIAVQLMKNNRYPEILNPRYIRFLKRAAPMHDIGKIVVPDAVLKKPGKLTTKEFELMKNHASEGGRIVHEILDGYEDSEYIQITADIATYHHEKWDGTGYPKGLKGEEIPLCARIMALADVFDALVSPRVYKSPMSYEEAYSIIESGMGTHFDPIIAQEFLNIKEKTAAVNESFKSLV